ncbi:MAG: FAD-binding oxidoreductase [Patescibacteria group bacterium]|nr:FAD-binding oxidoreductase [Patescibacteria group bacterium]
MNSVNNEGVSLWKESHLQATYPQIVEDLEVDTVVVGAGITGLTVAYMLKRSGQKVAVLDKSTVGGGTTARTTGKVTSQHNLVYKDLQDRLGNKIAQVYADANQTAVETVASIIKREKISCEWEIDDNYVYTTDSTKVEEFKTEADVAASLGLPSTYETTSPLPFAIEAAIKFTGQGKMHSQKYLLGLAAAVNGDGSFVFEESGVIGIHDGDPGKVRTRKASVTAKSIVVATSVPTMPLVARGAYCILEYPKESYIVAGTPEKVIKGMYISPDKDNYSILPIAVNGSPTLLIGGKGHISGLRISKDTRYTTLSEYAAKHFGMNQVTHRWSDRDYIAYDGIPLAGKLYPWSKNLYVGSAYRKWGLSNGTAAAMIIHDLIIGIENPWASTYDPIRLDPIKSIPHVAKSYISKK